MSVLWVMIPLALMLGGTFVFAFIRMAQGGQFEDLDTPAYRILIEEKENE